MSGRRDTRRDGGWIRRLDWIGFGAGLAMAAAAWLIIHGGQADGPGRELAAAPTARGAAAAALGADSAHAAKRAAIGNAQAASARSGEPGDAIGGAASGSAAGANAPLQADQKAAAVMPTDKLLVRIYLSDEKKVETIPLETYVRGVVAAEMPLDFEPAALEAQALAARTYIIRRLLNDDRSGVPVDGADVTDTQTHQVYRSQAEMAELKASDPKGWAKADDAAQHTRGKILTYEGEPIEALYFSSSDGYTENSENVFPYELPYLRSVASPWDREEASGWSDTLEMSLQEFGKKLGVSTGAILARSSGAETIRVLDRTPGNQVKTLQVGSEKLSGVEVRDKLDLKSAAFELTATGRNVVITTYGSGHGVGMSQWGAEGMAKSGKTAEQIVQHYYTGIQVEEASKLADRLVL
ncbi:stage II sporulation protein D [Cohnella lubricantis]|uniref:Stage II sporulation protein D n=1 Tax=Cohnella lubricantis TaxID=2163172 RepID=A0A841TK13_9BACL|nr:stage II sporulation protein D [Cohnella lubricantis]MBB6679558.1 stage II sporulation protein D [Cohnella lubricantis]MBP2117832.1 stage II sporulation protein D [Cohnella lubricantis]